MSSLSKRKKSLKNIRNSKNKKQNNVKKRKFKKYRRNKAERDPQQKALTLWIPIEIVLMTIRSWVKHLKAKPILKIQLSWVKNNLRSNPKLTSHPSRSILFLQQSSTRQNRFHLKLKDKKLFYPKSEVSTKTLVSKRYSIVQKQSQDLTSQASMLSNYSSSASLTISLVSSSCQPKSYRPNKK